MKLSQFVLKLKHKRELTEEGKNIHTCGLYKFCDNCQDYNGKKKKPCCFESNKNANPIMTIEEFVKSQN